MKQNLTFWEILPVGLMLFSSFFGAGNLIFPPALGQAAGDHFWSAAIGFCVTGVGMPLLGIIAMALTKNDNPNALADPVHPNFAKIIVMLAVLTIGPLFAIPRTGAVSYDVGIRPFVPEDYYTAGLAIYSLFFFIVTYVLSINPSKLVDWLGKVLTPMLLLSLAVLIINVLLAPMGPMQPATGSYINLPFLSGFQDGYNTMDLLATLLFGATVINAIKLKGITDDAATGAFAQGNGVGGIVEATNMVTSYFDPATKLIYAIGAVVGLIGGVKVYSKFSSGDPDTSKTAASWFGACIFLIVAATILRSFFL